MVTACAEVNCGPQFMPGAQNVSIGEATFNAAGRDVVVTHITNHYENPPEDDRMLFGDFLIMEQDSSVKCLQRT